MFDHVISLLQGPPWPPSLLEHALHSLVGHTKPSTICPLTEFTDSLLTIKWYKFLFFHSLQVLYYRFWLLLLFNYRIYLFGSGNQAFRRIFITSVCQREKKIFNKIGRKRYTKTSFSAIIVICVDAVVLKNSIFVSHSSVESITSQYQLARFHRKARCLRDYIGYWRTIKIKTLITQRISLKGNKLFCPYKIMSSVLSDHPQRPLKQN